MPTHHSSLSKAQITTGHQSKAKNTQHNKTCPVRFCAMANNHVRPVHQLRHIALSPVKKLWNAWRKSSPQCTLRVIVFIFFLFFLGDKSIHNKNEYNRYIFNFSICRIPIWKDILSYRCRMKSTCSV